MVCDPGLFAVGENASLGFARYGTGAGHGGHCAFEVVESRRAGQRQRASSLRPAQQCLPAANSFPSLPSALDGKEFGYWLKAILERSHHLHAGGVSQNGGNPVCFEPNQLISTAELPELSKTILQPAIFRACNLNLTKISLSCEISGLDH